MYVCIYIYIYTHIYVPMSLDERVAQLVRRVQSVPLLYSS